jgi:glycerol-3-phosphate dehydrogenase (NAD(P)+)
MSGKEKSKILVIGGGSWATALAKVISENTNQLMWWMRSKDAISHLQKFSHNPKYLQSASFDMNYIELSDRLQDLIFKADVIIVAVPSAFIHDTFKDVPKELFKGKVIFSAVKGMIPEFNVIPARYFHKEYGTPYNQLGIICGPCHAEEVAMERLSYLTVASSDAKVASHMSSILECRYIKTTLSDDLFGTEFSAILKNVYALAAGVTAGLGYGDNFQAVLISSSIREINTFIDAVHPIHRDTKTSAYLGDLLVTAYSKFSRNRSFGFMIGKGYSVKTAQLEMNMIAEGYYAVKSLAKVKKEFKVSMPILESVYSILYENASPKTEMKKLTECLD